MQHSSVILRLLFPTNQDSTESVHPTVCPFCHPPAGFESRGPSDQPGLLAARTNVRGESEFPRQTANFVVVIPFVQTQALRLVQRWPGPFHGNAFDRLPRQLEVVDVRPRHGQSHRNAVGLHQQTSLGAGFGSIRGIRTGFSPRPAEPWSSLRPYSATTSSVPSTRRTLPIRSARASETRLPASIPETAGGPWNSNRFPSRSTHSMGNRSAPRTRSRRSHPDHFAGAVPAPADPRSRAPATTARRTPKTHPNTAIRSTASLHPPFRASMPDNIIDQLRVFGIGS